MRCWLFSWKGYKSELQFTIHNTCKMYAKLVCLWCFTEQYICCSFLWKNSNKLLWLIAHKRFSICIKPNLSNLLICFHKCKFLPKETSIKCVKLSLPLLPAFSTMYPIKTRAITHIIIFCMKNKVHKWAFKRVMVEPATLSLWLYLIIN